MRGVTGCRPNPRFAVPISTHTPRERRDTILQRKRTQQGQFQLTRLVRGVTQGPRRHSRGLPFQLTRLVRGVTGFTAVLVVVCDISTHTPRERRDVGCHALSSFARISTHTPRERRDLIARKLFDIDTISTHTPRERRDFGSLTYHYPHLSFQLTRLVRGVTLQEFFERG